MECNEELVRTLDEQRCIHEAEIERLSRSNQIQCANLDSKLAEAEKALEELIRDKKNLEATLSKDTNEKVAVNVSSNLFNFPTFSHFDLIISCFA